MPEEGDQTSLIHDAAQRGDVLELSRLIERGHDVDTRSRLNWTPLHIAARFGYTEMVKSLLAHGANIHQLTDDGKTAFDFARRRHPETAAILEQADQTTS